MGNRKILCKCLLSLGMKKEKTLGSLPDNTKFVFGGVEFLKKFTTDMEEEMSICHIGDTNCAVYISNCAWVAYELRDSTSEII
ncbi:hypothetical protein DRF65_13870 [Chryseobacterium pennae]|uniref:Uncharacterized protein n=2 Tax=Chryseobacterium pennae TaxID=2258962 RepID=A0A3D9C7F8_9FLAO|nr:hypothetical protein DRF65_13870 [Chryseobacterium pennae]